MPAPPPHQQSPRHRTDQPLVSHHSQLLFIEPVTTNLSSLIRNRRALSLPWTHGDFFQLMRQVVEGVSSLHKNWLAHNDIRPFNIFYFHPTQQYLVSSFSSVQTVLGMASPTSYRDVAEMIRESSKF